MIPEPEMIPSQKKKKAWNGLDRESTLYSALK